MRIHVNVFRLATFFGFLFFTNLASAQETVTNTAVYFESSKHNLNKKATEEIRKWLSEQQSGCVVHISGNTDAVGSEQYNIELAQRRCESVKSFLLAEGLAPEEVVVEALGESKPISDNETDNGKQKNRRVDIEMKCPVADEPVLEASSLGEDTKSVEDLNKLMMLLATTPQWFSIDPRQDTTVVCEGGTILYFRANAISIPSSYKDKVDISVRENFTKSSMICDNLATQSGDGILETGGMVEVKAFDKSKKELRMKMKDGMSTFVPTEDANPNMSVFDGKRHGKRKTAKWKQRSTGNLRPFGAADIMDCNYRWMYKRQYCNWWCKTKSLFTSSPVRESAIVGSRRVQKCAVRRELLKNYGVKDYDALVDAMNRDLFASVGVNTAEEYEAYLKAQEDSLRKRNQAQFEADVANGIADASDLQYYVFSNSNFGYYNCDYFMNLPANEVISLNIPNPDGKATYLSLVFENRNAVVSPEYRTDSFYFKKVKEDIYATVVAIRSNDGQPQLAMQRVKITRNIPDLVFEDVSVEMLKEKLKILDGEDGSTAMK